MCERSAIFCWSNVYTVGLIIYTTSYERHFYYMERGIQPNLQREWVYYAVTDGGRDIMFASVSELTSDALYFIKSKFLAVEKVLAKSSEGFD